MRRRRFWIILAAALVAEVLLVAAWKGWFAPAPEVSALYMRYVDDPDVEASFAKGFRINDTLAIDATLLRAKDSAAWERLTEELEIPAPHERVIKGMKKGKDVIISYLAKKGTTKSELGPDLNNSDAIGVSYLNQTIAIYHIHNRNEMAAVLRYNSNISTKH